MTVRAGLPYGQNDQTDGLTKFRMNGSKQTTGKNAGVPAGTQAG